MPARSTSSVTSTAVSVELLALLEQLGYDTTADPIVHPDGRRVVFLGDLVDRGPGVAEVLDVAHVDGGRGQCAVHPRQPREQAESRRSPDATSR